MRCETLIASTSRLFQSLDIITELRIPECNVWCGDFPYVNKSAFIALIESLSEKNKEWNIPANNWKRPIESMQMMTENSGKRIKALVVRNQLGNSS